MSSELNAGKYACPFGKEVSTRSDKIDEELFLKLVGFDEDIKGLKKDMDKKFEDIADRGNSRDTKMKYIFWMGVGSLVLGIAKLLQGTVV